MDLRHVRIDDGAPALVGRWLGICQAEERARHDRLLVEAARTWFALAHLAVRLVFAEALACDPAQVRIGSQGSGRPTVDGMPFVSWSRSSEHVLIGMDRANDLGVDIEAEAGAPEPTAELWDLIASPPEASLASEPDAILRLWTLKESAVKAVGLGLRLDIRTLRPLERLPLPGSPVELIDGWSSQAVHVGGGAVAAVTSRSSTPPRLRESRLLDLTGALP